MTQHFSQATVRGRFAMRHNRLPVLLSSWSGSLCYSMEGDERALRAKIMYGDNEEESVFRAENNDAGLEVVFNLKEGIIACSVSNRSNCEIVLERIILESAGVSLGEEGGRYSFFRNGYQSWTETRTFFPEDRALRCFLPTMNIMQDNMRNLNHGRRGEFTSDMFAVMGNITDRIFLLAGQADTWDQYVYVKARLPRKSGESASIQLTLDFGGRSLDAGEGVSCDRIILLADENACMVQDRYFERNMIREPDRHELPTGWCSWYYYYSRVTEEDMHRDLDTASGRGVNWKFFVLDDGYETAMGDWLSVNDKFPEGLEALSGRISESGMVPGIWLAPFVARKNSRLFREHPDWFLKDEKGRPCVAGWNPNWGLGGLFCGLDTTNKEFQEYLKNVITTFVHQWGFRYLKLDFTYGASLYGRASDRNLSSAERLRLGYSIIRQTAGEEVFILGCGSPMSSAVGLVDAMRIGPDVCPYWFCTYRYHLTRDANALCTRSAIRSILLRSRMHRRLWINDPDCLLLREKDTKLTEPERMCLVNAVIVTGGMYVISDRLSLFSRQVWDMIGTIDEHVRACDLGRVRVPDYMDREIPELAYNTEGYLAVFNFGERAVKKVVDFNKYLSDVIEPDQVFTDLWSGRNYTAQDRVLDMGIMQPHSSCLLRVNARS